MVQALTPVYASLPFVVVIDCASKVRFSACVDECGRCVDAMQMARFINGTCRNFAQQYENQKNKNCDKRIKMQSTQTLSRVAIR